MAVSRAMRQIILMGVICFGTIGMFNAMSSIGNAGKHSPTAQNLAITSSSIAYIVGFLLAGGTHNMIGPRLCVAFGGLTFVLYAGSMMLAKDNDRSVYPPLAGILLGLGAGCIWVTQGAMMMSYPTEDNKGKYIACFWAIFNLGAVLGSILPLVMNNAPGMDPDDVSPSTYIVYMVVMGLATLLAIFLARPSSIIRDNGEPVNVAKFAGLRAECLAILSVFCDWRMLLLIPAFFFSNFSYTYQFNDFNGFNFNIRTRSLNSMLFWVAQIIGALLIGYLLDRIPVKRPKRAVLGLIVIGALFMATWVAALVVQLKHKWERKQLHRNDLIDYEHGSNYTGLMAIYAMFGFCDAAFAVYCYWLMGALSNKHDELSRYAGFFKSIQSLGSAVAAPLDLAQTPLKEYLITNWILCALSIAAMFLVCRTVTDTTLEDGDENEEEEEEEYDEELDMDDSYYDASVNEEDETAAQGQTSREHSSFEGDVSTLCATSEAGKSKIAFGSRSSGQTSGCWRTSSRTSGLQEDYIEEEDPRQSRSSNGMLGTGDRASFNSNTVSASSTTVPSRAYQSPHQHYPHQQLDRNSYRLGGMPPMAEIPHDPTTGVGPAHWMRRTPQQPLYPQLIQSSMSAPSILTPPASGDAVGMQPQNNMYPYSSQSGSSTGASPTQSAPTFMISHESSAPMPLYTFYPGVPYLSQPWLGPGGLQYGGFAGPDTNNDVATEFLQPHEPFNPGEMVIGGSTTRYEDEQDMDSIDTHSVSSMSSDHDSIPEMPEMSEATRDRRR